MIIGYFLIKTEDGKRGYIRPEDVSAFFESKVSVKPGVGRPAAGQAPGMKMVDCVTLWLHGGNRFHAEGETVETIVNKMKQAMPGSQLHLVHTLAEGGPTVRVERDDDAEAA